MSTTGDKFRFLVQLLRKAVTAYQSGRLGIDRLSWELKSAIAELDGVSGVDPRWVDELRTMRNGIEEISAGAVTSGRTTLTDPERRDVTRILGEMRAALMPY